MKVSEKIPEQKWRPSRGQSLRTLDDEQSGKNGRMGLLVLSLTKLLRRMVKSKLLQAYEKQARKEHKGC